MVFKADVAVEKDVKDMVEAAVARFGRLDIMFNNAGEISFLKAVIMLSFVL